MVKYKININLSSLYIFNKLTILHGGRGINATLVSGETRTWDLQVCVGVLYHWENPLALSSLGILQSVSVSLATALEIQRHFLWG